MTISKEFIASALKKGAEFLTQAENQKTLETLIDTIKKLSMLMRREGLLSAEELLSTETPLSTYYEDENEHKIENKENIALPLPYILDTPLHSIINGESWETVSDIASHIIMTERNPFCVYCDIIAYDALHSFYKGAATSVALERALSYIPQGTKEAKEFFDKMKSKYLSGLDNEKNGKYGLVALSDVKQLYDVLHSKNDEASSATTLPSTFVEKTLNEASEIFTHDKNVLKTFCENVRALTNIAKEARKLGDFNAKTKCEEPAGFEKIKEYCKPFKVSPLLQKAADLIAEGFEWSDVERTLSNILILEKDASERLLGIAALDGLGQVMRYETPLALITRLSSYIPTCTEKLKKAQFNLLKEFLRTY